MRVATQLQVQLQPRCITAAKWGMFCSSAFMPHSSCALTLSTPDPCSFLALCSSGSSVSQRISLLWQEAVKDFNTVWQETNSQMGLRSARDSTVISVNGRQGSVETWKGRTGPASFVCFVGSPHLMEWRLKGCQFGEKKWYFWLHQ